MREPARRFLRGPSLRAEVFERDKGVCVMCGEDTVAFDAQFDKMRGSASLKEFYRCQTRRQLGIPIGVSLWHADHIIPASEGGGDTDIANLRTLCWRCHRSETADLRHRNSKEEQRERKLNRSREMREARHNDSSGDT